MSFRWSSAPNNAGYHGKVYSTGGRAGQGQHGSMSKHEMNNVMLAWGPGFNDTKPELLGSVPIAQPPESISFRLDRSVPSMQSSGSSSLRWDDY